MKTSKLLPSQIFAAAVLTATGLAGSAATAQDLQKVAFGTGWLAQAEHGGWYQALADGTYEKYGLDVEIVMGGPQTPMMQRLAAGQIQFMQGGTLGVFDAVSNGIPVMAVAAYLQKDPQALLTHPERGFTDLSDLAQLGTIYLGGSGYDTFFRWMLGKYEGFKDSQYAPYTYNPAVFLADEDSAMQSYVTSEPFDIEKRTGQAPDIFLLADYGFGAYANEIVTLAPLVAEDPELVQKFVDASTIGWYNYLYGDPSAANALIQKDNPEMTSEQIEFSRQQMVKLDMALSDAALDGGMGCMSEARHQDFYDSMVETGVLEPGLDLPATYTLQFTCKNVGADLYPDAAKAGE